MNTLLKYFEPDPDIVKQLTRGLNCHPILARLLSSRGIETVEDAVFFLNPNFDTLVDPFLLKDMDKAVKRIFTAVKNREKILVFGDFDADGVTATALVTDFLEYCNADVSWYIPHRIKEGHGITPDHVHIFVDQDIDLIMTVDCGISSHEAVQEAGLEDIDVVITDHHEPDAILPPALAVIDAKQKDCSSGLEHLAGAGVAFFLVMALRKFFRKNGFWEKIKEPNLLNYLDLFAIGTIGDMVPLIRENRVLCMAGLDKIRQGTRPGLQSLASICRIDLEKIDSDDISFKIVPRINAAGRISHGRICVSQFLTQDIVNAEKTASVLDQLNLTRQKIEKQMLLDIEQRLEKNPDLLKNRLIFLWDDHWNPGVLGIVASRLSKKHGCPVVLLSCDNDHAVGSGRSINNINIYQALRENEPLLEKFGGHARAAGLSIKKDNLKKLHQRLNQHLQKKYSRKDFQNRLTIDAVLDFEDINFNLAREIDKLGPFGPSNPEPVFLCKDINVKSSHIIGVYHRKMILEKNDACAAHQVEALHFNINDPDTVPDFYPQIVFNLKVNRFKDSCANIIIKDL